MTVCYITFCSFKIIQLTSKHNKKQKKTFKEEEKEEEKPNKNTMNDAKNF